MTSAREHLLISRSSFGWGDEQFVHNMNIPESVKLLVGEVTIRAGQLSDALTVAIGWAGSPTLADAFECAKEMRNREKILDEAKQYLKKCTTSNGVNIDVDVTIRRAKLAFRRRDEITFDRCFEVGAEGRVVSRCQKGKIPFDHDQLIALADEIMLLIIDLSAITNPNFVNDDNDQARLVTHS